ncbi:MAG: hypothetical protein ACLR13_02745 [Acutalibacteraceae bacterium]
MPLILASICGTVGAIIIGVPIGILTAVFLTEIARPRVAKIIHPAIELLAGIPSVVYGFFGMLVIVPAIRAMFPGQTIGDSLLAAIIILAIMVIPTIVNVTRMHSELCQSLTEKLHWGWEPHQSEPFLK